MNVYFIHHGRPTLHYSTIKCRVSTVSITVCRLTSSMPMRTHTHTHTHTLQKMKWWAAEQSKTLGLKILLVTTTSLYHSHSRTPYSTQNEGYFMFHAFCSKAQEITLMDLIPWPVVKCSTTIEINPTTKFRS